MSEDEKPWPDARGAIWTVVVLILTAALCTMDRLVLVLIVDPIRHDLLISETQMSLLQGLSFALLYSIVGIPVGLAADRWSRRNLLILGVSVWSLATFAAGLAGSFGHMFAARVFVGAGEAVLWPAAISMIADLLPPARRGRAVSGVLLGQIAGGSLALVLGGQVLRIAAENGFAGVPVLAGHAPWRVLLMLWGLFGVIAVILLLTAMEPIRRNQPKAGEVRLGLFKPFLNEVRAKANAVVPLFVLAFFTGVISYAAAAWNGAFFIRHFHVPPAQLGSMLGVVSLVAGLVGTLSGGWLSDRAAKSGGDGRSLLMMICMVGCLPGALLSLAPSVPIALAMYGVFAVFSPLNAVLVFVSNQNLFPGEARGMATAVLSIFAGLFGASAGPILVALVTQHVLKSDALVGYSLTIVQLPALGAALLCAWMFRRGSRKLA